MFNQSAFDCFTADVEQLLSKSVPAQSLTELTSSINDLKQQMLAGSSFQPAKSVEDTIIEYIPYVRNAKTNLGETATAHEQEYVRRLCENYQNSVRKTRKAQNAVIAAIFIFHRNTNRYDLAAFIMLMLGIKFSANKSVQQTVRAFLGLKKISGSDAKVKAANKVITDHAYRVNAHTH